MLADLPILTLQIAAGTFLAGWILAILFSSLRARFRVQKRDPRDDRIRELDAELRISQSETEKALGKLERLDEELKESKDGSVRRDNVISKQQAKIEQLSTDLKESVVKTRELRSELTDRATATVQAEAKIREVETELSVAQASTDMIVTGVLDYSIESEDDELGQTVKLDEALVRPKKSSAPS